LANQEAFCLPLANQEAFCLPLANQEAMAEIAEIGENSRIERCFSLSASLVRRQSCRFSPARGCLNIPA